MRPEHRQALIRGGLALLFIGVLSLLVYFLHDELRGLARFGYLGAFIIPMLANATVIVPVPGVMIVISLGALYNPYIVTILAGLGAAAGELTGYMVGYGGKGLLETSDRYRRMVGWFERHPRWSGLGILVMAAIPNPFFDLAGVAAGTMKIPVWRFYIFCAIGSIIKMAAFAFGGYHVGNYFLR